MTQRMGDACREPPRDRAPGMRETLVRGASGCCSIFSSAALAAATMRLGFTFSPAHASCSLPQAAHSRKVEYVSNAPLHRSADLTLMIEAFSAGLQLARTEIGSNIKRMLNLS